MFALDAMYVNKIFGINEMNNWFAMKPVLLLFLWFFFYKYIFIKANTLLRLKRIRIRRRKMRKQTLYLPLWFRCFLAHFLKSIWTSRLSVCWDWLWCASWARCSAGFFSDWVSCCGEWRRCCCCRRRLWYARICWVDSIWSGSDSRDYCCCCCWWPSVCRLWASWSKRLDRWLWLATKWTSSMTKSDALKHY